MYHEGPPMAWPFVRTWRDARARVASQRLAEVRERLHEVEQVVPDTLFYRLPDQLQHID
jgi:hypothetical protein